MIKNEKPFYIAWNIFIWFLLFFFPSFELEQKERENLEIERKGKFYDFVKNGNSFILNLVSPNIWITYK